MGGRRETELYGPVKQFLESAGFAVKGEVRGCDLVAVRGDQLIVVELKVAFNLALVLQGVERQRSADLVYVAVEAPRSRRAEPRWSDVAHLCRRLNLGLLTVSFAAHREPLVEVICEPGPYAPRRAPRERAGILKEFSRRRGDHNTGGSNKRPLMTAYRESALLVADHIHRYGPSQPKAVKQATGVEKAATILHDDVYGWFHRVERGVYALTPGGETALTTYADVLPKQTQGPEA